MAESRSKSGFKLSSPWEAQFLVINTCTVTSRTDRQIRQILRQAARQSPQAKIIVTGCYAQRSPGELAEFPKVQACSGISKRLPGRIYYPVILDHEKPLIQVADLAGCSSFAPMPLQYFRGHTRAFLKIQDGCDHSAVIVLSPRFEVRNAVCPYLRS